MSVAEFCARLAARRSQVEEWFDAEFAEQPLPFYCSVDLRFSADKVAPVDTNLFPGGFNNLAPNRHPALAEAAREVLAQQWKGAGRIALVAERHTRNPYYATHLGVLRDALQGAGAEVRVAFADGEPAAMKGHRSELDVGVLERSGDRLSVGGWEPDLLLLNNDQSAGTPETLAGACARMTPPLSAGWSQRRKSAHFFQYERVVSRFAREVGLDPWRLEAHFNVCGKVDISQRVGLDCLARAIDETVGDIRSNYERIGSRERPFVVLKAEAGTYGMGVVMLEEGADVERLNRSQRKNLSVIRDGVKVRDILIQEGIPSAQRVEGMVAEPVYYMIGSRVVGGFWRLNQRHGPRENLNSRGMSFWPLLPSSLPADQAYAGEVVARLALLASARELAFDLAYS